jgi:hypothetical protein
MSRVARSLKVWIMFLLSATFQEVLSFDGSEFCVNHVSEDLWHQLKRLGLNENDENHPLLGNNKQALELLVQQRLVVPSACVAESVFHWRYLCLM